MNDEPTPDIPLMRKTLEWAENEASKPQTDCGWFQSAYTVPATDPDRTPFPDMLGTSGYYQKSTEINGCGTAFCIAGYVYWQGTGDTGSRVSGATIADYAQRALGLTHTQADRLFAGSNSIERIRWIMEEAAGESL